MICGLRFRWSYFMRGEFNKTYRLEVGVSRRLILAMVLSVIWIPSAAFTQNDSMHVSPESITINKSFWGNKYYQGESQLKGNDLEEALSASPEAIAEYQRSKTPKTVSTVFAVVGGACIGWPCGEAIAGKEDPAWTLAYVGAGLVLVGSYFEYKAIGFQEGAIEMYNDELESSSEISRIRFEYALGPTGMWIVMRF